MLGDLTNKMATIATNLNQRMCFRYCLYYCFYSKCEIITTDLPKCAIITASIEIIRNLLQNAKSLQPFTLNMKSLVKSLLLSLKMGILLKIAKISLYPVPANNRKEKKKLARFCVRMVSISMSYRTLHNH